MRPIANFTLHAIVAAALAALAATSAAAAAAAAADYYLKLDPGKPVLSKAEGGEVAGAGAGGQIAIESYSWGPRQSTSLDSTAKAHEALKMQPGGGGAGAAGKVDPGPYAPANTTYANVKMTHADSDASAGKGASNEMRMEDSSGAAATHDPPPERGSLTMKGSFPGCTVGQRYAGAQFAAGAMRYELQDVVISGCTATGLSLNYAKVKVRGWEPEKKE